MLDQTEVPGLWHFFAMACSKWSTLCLPWASRVSLCSGLLNLPFVQKDLGLGLGFRVYPTQTNFTTPNLVQKGQVLQVLNLLASYNGPPPLFL